MPDRVKEKVLITGANGFVGSHLCRRLSEDGYHVVAGIRDGCDGSLISELNLEYRFGDVTEPNTLPEMVKGIDYIIHNAGVVKAAKKERFFEVNQIGTRNLLEAVSKYGGPKKFVFISSTAAVGPSDGKQPLVEDDAPHPITTYGHSKLAGEQEVKKLSETINSIIIRPPAVYGPGDKETLIFFQMLNNRVKPYLGNPRRRIQLVHADDLSRGIAMALKAKTKSGSEYFIAESVSYSYYSLVRHLRQAVGRTSIPFYLPGWMLKSTAKISQAAVKAFGGAPMFTVEKANELLADWEVSVEKAARDFGFKSKISFPDGARETFYWYRDEGWLS